MGEDAAWRLRALLRLERGGAASRRNAQPAMRQARRVSKGQGEDPMSIAASGARYAMTPNTIQVPGSAVGVGLERGDGQCQS
jgi:hypothetical protein